MSIMLGSHDGLSNSHEISDPIFLESGDSNTVNTPSVPNLGVILLLISHHHQV